MKKLSLILLTLLLGVLLIGTLTFNQNSSIGISNADFLRLHIRANSNAKVDQDIKFLVKTEVLNYINKDATIFSSKKNIENYFKNNKEILQSHIDNFLKIQGYTYTSNIKLNNEYFPTRTLIGVILIQFALLLFIFKRREK